VAGGRVFDKSSQFIKIYQVFGKYSHRATGLRVFGKYSEFIRIYQVFGKYSAGGLNVQNLSGIQ